MGQLRLDGAEKHARWRGVDDAGVIRKRTTGPRPVTVALDGREPASRTPGPSVVVEDRHAAAITQALGQLPASLREPLMASMQDTRSGRSPRTSNSESTAHQRIKKHVSNSGANSSPRARTTLGVVRESG